MCTIPRQAQLQTFPPSLNVLEIAYCTLSTTTAEYTLLGMLANSMQKPTLSKHGQFLHMNARPPSIPLRMPLLCEMRMHNFHQHHVYSSQNHYYGNNGVSILRSGRAKHAGRTSIGSTAHKK
eukprot:scaffold676857_cov57-Prasinocladus_malaysianus.AAC.1